jgi:hypothetical protein
MAKRGIFARLLGLPSGPLVPKTAKAAAAARSGPKSPPMTANRKALIQEAMRVHGKMREELGEEEIEKMAKAIMGEKKP